MRWVYSLLIGAGWGYMAATFHWSFFKAVVATSLTYVTVFYASRVIEEDRKS